MAFVALTENERFGPITGNATIFGTANGRETVTVANGDFTFDGSYNSGGDTIIIGGNARDFTILRSGSSAVLRSANTTISLPLSASGATTLTFNDTSLSIRFDQSRGVAILGDQTLTTNASAITVPATNTPVPVVVVAGQSNAEITGLDSLVYDGLVARGGAFEFVHRAAGGTSLFANADQDWDPASNELLAQLIVGVNAAIANVRAQGAAADVRILWVQGEADVGRSVADYNAKLTAFIAALRAGIGVPQASFTIALLPFESTVRIAQLAVDQAVTAVQSLETIGARFFDGVHYDRGTTIAIADRFLAEQAITPAALSGYRNLTPAPTITVDASNVVFVTTAFGSTTYIADQRPHVIRTGSGDDYLLGGAGNDQFFTGAGDDTIITGAGGNFVDAGHGNDTIIGGADADFILGRFGSDRIDGGGGDDTIGGGDQDDVIYGGSGNDLIYGELGADVIQTGPGNDRIGYYAVNESTPAAPDVITDFTPGQDRIDLSAIDANATTAANDAFRFIGTAAFSGVAGEVRYVVIGGVGRVEADVDGNRTADLVVTLTGAPTLTAADFVL